MAIYKIVVWAIINEISLKVVNDKDIFCDGLLSIFICIYLLRFGSVFVLTVYSLACFRLLFVQQ